MRFDDLEIVDLNGDDEKVVKFPSDNPNREIEEDDEKVDWKKEVKSFVFTILITLAIVFVLKNYIIINAEVPTGSMENNIAPTRTFA